MACAWIVVITIGVAGDASAACGAGAVCGRSATSRCIFSPLGPGHAYRATTSLGTLRDVIFRDDLTKGLDDYEGYNLDDDNAGFQPKMTYTSQDDPKRRLIMIEKSSQRISHRSHLVCGRDEITDIFRKVYRFKRDGASAAKRHHAMHGISAHHHGGRPCTFN